ncbi:hypothetical protein A2U01_0028249, partial [Trifolium medium]|nr:hypothetical protein [Trifolium medium]
LQLSELHAAFDDYKNKYALQQKLVIDLEATELKLAEVVQERDTLLTKVKGLEDKVRGLEDKLKETEGKGAEGVFTEEEKAVDRAGIYAGLSRAMLVSKIFELNDNMLETASSQFHNAVAQIRALNAGMKLNLEGLDEQVMTPQDDEEI